MVEAATIQKIYKEIKELKREVHFIKEHMFDPDTIMTPQEEGRYDEAMRELTEGKTTSLSDMKKRITLSNL